MDELRLVPPSLAYAEAIISYRAESLAEAPHISGGCMLADFPEPADWIAYCECLGDPATLPPGRVETEEWMLVRGDEPRVLGLINIRRSIDHDYLREYAGHIGYSVRPTERRKGYAAAQLRLGLDRCRALGLDRVLITCDTTNEGSRRTILACGGLFDRTTFDETDNTTMERYWIPLIAVS
ncbi:MAG: GNAT family N-acetyltransferase [Propionibacteriaceae bacterium]|jgi:predicted acetyltransferase|nr:GNAT family N-acetyltransferase [Propionibacteriaceae bacterium]